MAGKFMFPKFLEKTPCRIVLYSNEQDEETGKANKELIWQGDCIWSEKSKRVFSTDRQEINLMAQAIIEGDIAPDLSSFAGGRFTIFPGTKKQAVMRIHASYRPRNPDGSIHHTSLELI